MNAIAELPPIKRLARQSFHRQPVRKEKARMTILLGIKCADGIVLASDSQSTSPDGVKLLDSKKISILPLADDFALVAESGNVVFSGRVLEELTNAAKLVELTDYRTVADLASDAMSKVKREIKRVNLRNTMREADGIIDDQGICGLMIAHYFNGQPYIFNIFMKPGIADLQRRDYTAMGTGAPIAMYVMGEIYEPNMDYRTASALAIYVVDAAKKHNAYCGGQTQLALIPAKPKRGECIKPKVFKGDNGMEMQIVTNMPPMILSNEEVEFMGKIVSKVDADTKTERNRKLREEIRKVTAERMKIMFELSLKRAAECQQPNDR